MQDPTNSNCIQISGVIDQGNKSIALPNQNLQILTNPMPSHNISLIKASETETNVMNIDTYDENTK